MYQNLTCVESARVFAAASRAPKRMKESSGVLGLLSKTRIEQNKILYSTVYLQKIHNVTYMCALRACNLVCIKCSIRIS